MTNAALFITQILSLLTYVGISLKLYSLLVKNKDATIQFLQTQLTEAKQPISDTLFKSQKDRLDAALIELERHTKDNESLQGTNKRVQGYVDALLEVVRAQQELIKLQKKFGDRVLKEYTNEVKKEADPVSTVISPIDA